MEGESSAMGAETGRHIIQTRSVLEQMNDGGCPYDHPTTVPDDAADDAINPVKVKQATGDMGKSC